MCDCQRTRRDVLRGALGVAGAAVLAACGRPGAPLPPAALPTVQVAPGLHIHPRDTWGADLPPKGFMGAEDVRFLLVHHTATSNVVADPRSVVRQTYAWHTSSAKGWPDICYHFMIGPDGSVWEARAGSLAGPVVADATGGNQGFAQLVCLIGDFTSQLPTPAAQDSLMRTLIFLADRYDIDTDPSATASFVSRGSNKFRAGTPVTTSTVSGHRDVTYTGCPGDLGYTMLDGWRRRVHASRLVRDEPGPLRSAVRLGVHLS